MGRARRIDTRQVDADSDDLIREASAMTMLLPIGSDCPSLVRLRRRARELFARARLRRDASGVLPGVPPTREELDELWALVPEQLSHWAHGTVDRAVETARQAGSTATPQRVVLEVDDQGRPLPRQRNIRAI